MRRYFFPGARLILIKSVLDFLPIHEIHLFPSASKGDKKTGQVEQKFSWQGNKYKRTYLDKWNNITTYKKGVAKGNKNLNLQT